MQATSDHVREVLAGRSPDELAGIFSRASAPPPAPDGRYRGDLLAVTMAPGLNRVFKDVFERTRPWLGKRFDAGSARGENVLDRSLWSVGRLLTPSRYRAWWPEDDETFRAFPFVTSVGPSMLDPAVSVLRIDYDLEQNHPRLRRILDELVEVEPGLYLGQALWRRGSGRRLAWFWLA
jgi:hypothetical protein